MSTTIRPELSERNKYWIDKHRYYELKHFCLQYPIWKKARAALNSLNGCSKYLLTISKNIKEDSPVEKCVEARLFYTDRIKMIENAACEANEIMAIYILKAVTEGISYEHLRASMNIPCCRDTYYELYRRFFWILSNKRK